MIVLHAAHTAVAHVDEAVCRALPRSAERLAVARVQEAECFVRAASLPVHKALVWVFLGQRSTQRVRFCPASVIAVGLQEGGAQCSPTAMH